METDRLTGQTLITMITIVLGPGSLVLCSGSLPHGIPFAERVAAAVAGGFDGMSIFVLDYELARAEGLSDGDLYTMLDDNGIELADLDAAWRWVPGSDEWEAANPDRAAGAGSFSATEETLFHIAAALGARSINALALLTVREAELTLDDYAEAFAGLCDRAADHGLPVHLEFVPWVTRVNDVVSAWEVVSRAGRPNGGLQVDTWHFFRGNPDFDALRRVPPERLMSIQISDGPVAREADLWDETARRRLLPGEGSFDLGRFVGTVVEMRAEAPIGVEVFSDALRQLPPEEIGRRTGAAARAVLAAAPSARP